MKEDIQKEYPNFYRKKIRRGSRNFLKEAAMTEEECERAILEGFSFIGEKQKEYDIFSNGEMGIGNTTTSSAVLYAMTQKNIHEVVGHGGGLSEEGLLRKKDRKSTRLNSSHANISYAVFCLKKKNTYHIHLSVRLYSFEIR